MARWRRNIGPSIDPLYERTPFSDEIVDAGLLHPDFRVAPETSLAQVMADLGLTPLTPDDEKTVRDELALIIGRGSRELEGSPKHGALTVADVQKAMRRIASGLDVAAKLVATDALHVIGLDAIERTLLGAETGFRDGHDTAVAQALIGFLAEELKDQRKARDLVLGFRNHPSVVADACRRAAKGLASIKGTDGRPRISWYHDFRGLLEVIAQKNGIRPTISNDPRTGQARGRFLDLALAFERILPPYMRSLNSESCAQRLKRSRRRAN